MSNIKESSSSALEVYLHPLVLINISDHFTRTKVQLEKKDANPRVLGALYGTQEGRKIEIRISFEFVYVTNENGQVIIDSDYVKQKKQQYEQVFPKYEVLGWYSTTDSILPADESIHEQIMQFNDNPLYLTLSTKFGPTVKDLPVNIYESTIQVSNDKNNFLWNKIPYKIETEESERIGVDNVSNLGVQDINSSSLVPHFTSVINAISMLKNRINVIIEYLSMVDSGKVEPDYKILRQISSLSHRLPAVDSPKFSTDFTNEVNETLMVTYLASMTKGVHVLNELIEKYNTTFERRGRRGAF